MMEEQSTLERILAAARSEFLEKGFKAATLRGIASRADVTTGALYRYYSSKEDLFGALVSSTYWGLMDIYRDVLESFQQLPMETQQGAMMEYTMKGVSRMTDFMYLNMDAMKLILTASEGTVYSDLVHRMAKLDDDATHEFAEGSNDAGFDNVHLVDPRLEHMLTSGMFSMYFDVIIQGVPREEADALIKDLIEFWSAGWQRLMGF